MSSLIDDLLLLARADTGRSSVAFEAMDLAETVRAVTGEMRILAEASGLRLTTSIPSECPMTGDPDALRRVLLVLLDNAIKYTGERRGDRGRDAGRGGFRTAECDRGGSGHGEQGIGAEDLPRIFDRFYRISADRSHAEAAGRAWGSRLHSRWRFSTEEILWLKALRERARCFA